MSSRRDKGLIQLAEDLVRNFIAIVLDGFDDLDLLRHSGVVGQHVREGLCAGNNVFRLFLEQDEEIPVVWHQPLQESWHGNSLPPEERSGR